MGNNENGAKDFAPDLINLPKENLKNRKISVVIDDEVAYFLGGKRAEGYNISAFVNQVLRERKEVEGAIIRSNYDFKPSGFVQFSTLLHRDVAEFFSIVSMLNGSIALANKITELLAQDTCGLLLGDCQVYGSAENLNKALARFVRATERIKIQG